MILQLENKNKGLSVLFYERLDMLNIAGQSNTLLACYPDWVRSNLSFQARNLSGFFGNNTINPFAERGVNEDGTNFKANNFSARTVSWEFDNVTSKGNLPISPNNYLNVLLLEKNDTLTLSVFTDSTYVNEFYVTENTNTELGVIELTTSTGSDGIYWKSQQITNEFKWFDRSNSVVPLELPKVLLMNPNYPLTDNIVNLAISEPKIIIGGSLTSGVWEGLRFTNNQNGDTFVYDNFNNDDYIVVDSKDLTVRNLNGVDRFSNFTGVFPRLEAGNNEIQWSHTKNEVDYFLASIDLPQDFGLTVEQELLTPGIQ